MIAVESFSSSTYVSRPMSYTGGVIVIIVMIMMM